MSGAPESPPPARGWGRARGGDLAYQASAAGLADARLGAQMGVREQYGAGRVLAEIFVLKSRWRGHVGAVIPVALEPATGRWMRLAARYVPPAAAKSPGAGQRGLALVGGVGDKQEDSK